MRRPAIRRAHVRCPKICAIAQEGMTGVKNVITADARGSEIALNGVTVGLDLSDSYSSLCLLDPTGEIIEEGRVRTRPSFFAQRFGAMPPCRVVLEVGTHSPG